MGPNLYINENPATCLYMPSADIKFKFVLMLARKLVLLVRSGFLLNEMTYMSEDFSLNAVTL